MGHEIAAGNTLAVPARPRIRFLADPIAIEHAGRTVLFVEDFNHDRQKGVISAVEFAATGPIGLVRCVLEEPWHLSYPFVLALNGCVWMIPESSANREVALYRADPFPNRWVKEATLLRDVPATDATVVVHEGRYWLLTPLTPLQTCICSRHLVFLALGRPTKAIRCCAIRVPHGLLVQSLVATADYGGLCRIVAGATALRSDWQRSPASTPMASNRSSEM